MSDSGEQKNKKEEGEEEHSASATKGEGKNSETPEQKHRRLLDSQVQHAQRLVEILENMMQDNPEERQKLLDIQMAETRRFLAMLEFFQLRFA